MKHPKTELRSRVLPDQARQRTLAKPAVVEFTCGGVPRGGQQRFDSRFLTLAATHQCERGVDVYADQSCENLVLAGPVPACVARLNCLYRPAS
jgi:hypothetical protein